VYFLEEKNRDCSQIKLSVFFYELNNRNPKNMTALTFEKEDYNRLRCKLQMRNFLNTNASQ
jgi:hypothetical protein